MITILPQPEHKRILVTMTGLLSVADVEAFGHEEQMTVTAMGLKSGEYDVLLLTIGSIIQTQAVTEAFGGLILNLPLKARKIAMVREGDLARMQSRRVMKLRDNACVFVSVTDAEAWLAEAD